MYGLKGSKPPLLWARNAYELSTVGFHWLFALYLVLCMY